MWPRSTPTKALGLAYRLPPTAYRPVTLAIAPVLAAPAKATSRTPGALHRGDRGLPERLLRDAQLLQGAAPKAGCRRAGPPSPTLACPHDMTMP